MEEGQLYNCMLASKEMVLPDQEMKLNCIKHNIEAEKRFVDIGPLPFLRRLDEEQANLKHISALYTNQLLLIIVQILPKYLADLFLFF